MASSTRVQVLLATVTLVSVVVVACSPKPEAPLEARLEVPLANLDQADPKARQLIEAQQTKLRELLSQPAAETTQTATAFGELGNLYHVYSFGEAAEASYRSAVALDPETVRWTYYLGQLLIHRGQPKAADEAFARAQRLAPSYAPIWVQRGRLSLDDGQLDQAAGFFSKALELAPNDVAAVAGQAQVALARRNYADAIDGFEAALRLEPKATSLHYPLAIAYRGQGDTARAQQHLDQRGDVKPPLRDPWMEQLRSKAQGRAVLIEEGVQAFRAGQTAAAQQAFKKAVEADPSDVTARLHLGDVLQLQGKSDLAQVHYEQAMTLAPEDPRVLLRLGTAATLLGRDAEGIDYLARSVAKEPTLKRAHLALAKALQRQGRHDQALVHYGAAFDLDPSNPEIRLGRALALVRLGRHDEARRRLEEDIQANPDQPAFRHVLARLLAASPDSDVRDGPRAVTIMQELVAEQRNLDLGQTLAMALAAAGRYDEAVQIQRAVMNGAKAAGREDLLPRMTANLNHYQAGRICSVPWETTDPIFAPPPDGAVGQAG